MPPPTPVRRRKMTNVDAILNKVHNVAKVINPESTENEFDINECSMSAKGNAFGISFTSTKSYLKATYRY